MRSNRSARPVLPPRYDTEWGTEFWSYVRNAMRPGVAVLDVGAGRRPTIARDERPENTYYVGLDPSGEELAASPTGAYDDVVVSTAEAFVPELSGRFDLIVAWDVLEHFRDLQKAAATFRRYTRPGGWFVAMLSGRYAAFAVANRLLPDPVARTLVAKLRDREPETVFPAYYDHCSEKGLEQAFGDWPELHVMPLWRGADYFMGFPRLLSLYIRYEDWAIDRKLENLATHYAVAACNSA